ncbi:MAG: 2-amino-4-hydroxy-6-hydroxymethyldihydropteridine diphosphokinase [Spirochaetes bacterium]|nr:2-amino-4-hydroxy-6-hydroxymethyldihydropteridine diphosphokinase [Spirochaetota bacterium]
MKYDLILSLGSNIEPKVEYLKQALQLLKENVEIVKISSIYQTDPQDDFDQEKFLNICVYVKTSQPDPFWNLEQIKQTENRIGRQKAKDREKGPRAIDIDILYLQNCKMDCPILTIPHKSIFKRNFVLVPLQEILGFIEQINLESRYINEKIITNKKQNVVKYGELSLE